MLNYLLLIPFDLFFSEIDYSRHVSCEPCLARVNGGYDPKANQVRKIPGNTNLNTHGNTNLNTCGNTNLNTPGNTNLNTPGTIQLVPYITQSLYWCGFQI